MGRVVAVGAEIISGSVTRGQVLDLPAGDTSGRRHVSHLDGGEWSDDGIGAGVSLLDWHCGITVPPLASSTGIEAVRQSQYCAIMIESSVVTHLASNVLA